MVHSGWRIAASKLRVDIQGTSGQDAMLTYSDGPNSLRTDVGAIFATTHANSLVAIDTSQSIKIANGSTHGLIWNLLVKSFYVSYSSN